MSEELIRLELKQLNAEMAEMRVELRQVRDRVLSTVQCPAPGSCLRLDSLGMDHERRLRGLEKSNWIIVGACMILNLAVIVAVSLWK
jgi:hypothetical protein